jgi:stalled ribosome alternative rescue factor ArfA
LKKTGEELQLYFHFKKRHGMSELKKGKGSYNRKKEKEKLRRGDYECT